MATFEFDGMERTAARLKALSNAARAEVWDAVDLSARAVKISADRRAKVPGSGAQFAFQTNVQEATARRRLSGRSPIVTKRLQKDLEIYIILRSFWTNARSAAVKSLFAKHGISDRLRRTSLWVDPRREKTNRAVLRLGRDQALREQGRTGARARRRKQHDSRQGLQRLPMRGKLLAWAQGKSRSGDVGRQDLKHIVRPPAAIALDLVLGPAARQHSDSTLARIRQAIEKAMRKT